MSFSEDHEDKAMAKVLKLSFDFTDYCIMKRR